MITDRETNFVYLSDLLESQCPNVFSQLLYWFDKLEIGYRILLGTKDLWVVDFMPFQLDNSDFVQFNYDPDYLKFRKYQHTVTNQTTVCDEIGIVPLRSAIVLDGGNIVKCKNKAILTTKIFKENPEYEEESLIGEIKRTLRIEEIILIPIEPGDFVGHADGLVRFVDESTVLVNEYPINKRYHDFQHNLKASLNNAGLKCLTFLIPHGGTQIVVMRSAVILISSK